MKLGIFTVSLPDYTPEEAIKVASEAGYDGLEWRIVQDNGDMNNPSFWSGNRTSMTPEQLMEKASMLKAEAAKYKIDMPSIAAYITSEDLTKVELAMRAANAIGAARLRVNAPSFCEDKSWEDQLTHARKTYAAVEELAKKYNVRALMEIHMGLFTYSVASARAVLEGLSPEYTGIMWDPGNQVREGLERYTVAIRSAGAYLAEVHVKNAAWRPAVLENGTLNWIVDWCQLPFGQVCWPEVIAALKQAGYNGWFMMEDFSTVQPLRERIEFNCKYVSGLLKD